MTTVVLSAALRFLWIVVFYVPLLIVIWQAIRAQNAYKVEADEPFTDLPLRPPGESTRKAAAEHFEKAVEWMVLLLLVSAIAGTAVAMTAAGSRLMIAGVFGAMVLFLAVVGGRRITKSLRTYWDYQLGFKGERVVAEELNQLMRYGWRVFHDLPFDGYNIDHVAVGPVGVFAIETKARRKWKERSTIHPAHVVKSDGHQLIWPSGAKTQLELQQAARNVTSLRGFLTKSTGEPVSCQPVLTFPGWWVESLARGTVLVASAKGLHRLLPKHGNTTLLEAQIQRIAFQLEQKCRPDDRS